MAGQLDVTEIDIDMQAVTEPQAIFGGDGTRCTRRNIHEVSPEIRGVADSVAALISPRYFQPLPSGEGFRLDRATVPSFANYLRAVRLPAWLEGFSDEPVPAFGTGFLVRPDLLLTAAHCITSGSGSIREQVSPEIVGTYVVFGFHTEVDSSERGFATRQEFGPDMVYTIASVVAFKYRHILQDQLSQDWALVKLDRPVVNRRPLNLGFQTLLPSANLFMIGCPWGLPAKYSTVGEGVTPLSEAPERHYIAHRIDSIGGNSGGPIFDAVSLEVVGIHIRGYTAPRGAAEQRFEADAVGVTTYQTGQRLETLHFIRATLSSLAPIQAAAELSWRDGVSLEGVCINCPDQTRQVVRFWSPTDDPGKLTLHSMASSRPDCPGGCGHPLRFIDFDHLVLSRCRYSFEGMNGSRHSSGKYVGKADQPMPFRIRVTGWRYIEIEVEPLQAQLQHVIG